MIYDQTLKWQRLSFDALRVFEKNDDLFQPEVRMSRVPRRVRFSIDLTVRNEWRNVDLLRTSVQNCFIAVFADLDGCHAIAMVTGELLENALKYGDWARGRPRDIPAARRPAARATSYGERPESAEQRRPNAQTLDSAIEWITSFPKPGAAYRARCCRSRSPTTTHAEPARARAHRVRGQLQAALAGRGGYRDRDRDA